MIKAAIVSLLITIAQSAPPLTDQQEVRAQDLMREIRCVACENEPISQSASDIAVDMRKRVRAMVAEGKSDAEIRDWFVDRYGEFVLFRPDAEGVSGKLLWGLPFLLLIGGGLVLLQRRSLPNEVESVAADHEDATST